MLETTSRFRINEKFVTSKMIDGEAIVINLSSGMYYSLDKTGGVVWLLIGGGRSLGQITNVLSSRFSAPAEQVREDLNQLVNDLLTHNLVLPADGAESSAPVELDPPTGHAYEPPVLNCYDDMGDVLALDPPLPQVEIENESWETSVK